MSTTTPQFGGLRSGPTKTRFTDVQPGDLVELKDTKSADPPFRAQVLESRKAHGPQREPALVFRPEGLDEAQLIVANGRWTVTIVTRADMLQTEDPDTALRLQTRPATATAVRFTGGINSAAEVIRWCAGRAVISWKQAVSNSPEHLVLQLATGNEPVQVGNYVVRDHNGAHSVATHEGLMARYQEEVVAGE